MTKEQIERILDRVRTWPSPLQEEAVETLLAIEALGSASVALSEGERAGVERGLDDLRNGRFASDEDMAAFFARHKA
ncbi:MAG: hypothetical protein WDM89_10565 [Rhizomicrobium sp.]